MIPQTSTTNSQTNNVKLIIINNFVNLLAVHVGGGSDGWIAKDAAHLPIIDVTTQKRLESSLLKVTVILFELVLVGGGANNPVWSTRRGLEVLKS